MDTVDMELLGMDTVDEGLLGMDMVDKRGGLDLI